MLKKRILLIEDDPLIVDIYMAKLKKSNFKVDSVSDGETALKILGQKKYDLLLLDIVLPYLTGFEVLQKIRNQSGLKNIKVLVLSNLGQKRDIERAQSLGVLKYLIKAHYTPSEVVEEIKSVFN